MKSTRKVLGHSLLRSLVRSHCSLIRLLRTARFARALRCSCSFARSLAQSLTPELMEKWFLSMEWTRLFHIILTFCAPSTCHFHFYWVSPSQSTLLKQLYSTDNHSFCSICLRADIHAFDERIIRLSLTQTRLLAWAYEWKWFHIWWGSD